MKLTSEQTRRINLLIEALESGEFTQTRGVLHDEVGYCCLGVACEVYRRFEAPGEQWEKDDMEPRGMLFLGEQTTLPIAVSQWFGFTRDDVLLPMDLISDELINDYASVLNDSEWSFKFIAEGFRRYRDEHQAEEASEVTA